MNTNSFLFAALFTATAFGTGCAAEEASPSSDETSSLTESSRPVVERAIATPPEAIGHWTFADASIPGFASDRLDLSITAEEVDVDLVTLASYENPLADKRDAVHVRSTGTARFGESGVVRIENISGATAFSIDLRLTDTGLSWCKTATACVSLTKSPF